MERKSFKRTRWVLRVHRRACVGRHLRRPPERARSRSEVLGLMSESRSRPPIVKMPESSFSGAEKAIQLSLDQEIHVTHQINALVELARSENDYITINFLQWFLTEQLEEVSSMDNLLKIVKRAGGDLLQADEYLARVGLRTMPEPPTA